MCADNEVTMDNSEPLENDHSCDRTIDPSEMSDNDVDHSLRQEDTAISAINSLFKARQVQRLHEILLKSMNDSDILKPRVKNVYAYNVTQQLPGILIEIWNAFLNEQPTASLVHLFGCFLSHFPIGQLAPPQIREQIKELISKTALLISEMVKSEVSGAIDLLLSFGHLKLLFHYYQSSTLEVNIDEMKWWDMTPLMSVHIDWKAFFEPRVKSSDAVAKQVEVLKLKLKFLDMMSLEQNVEVVEKSKKKIINLLLKLTTVCKTLQLTTVEELLPSLNSSEMSTITDILINQLYNGHEDVVPEVLQNSSSFQTSIITSLCQFLSHLVVEHSNFHKILELVTCKDVDWIQAASTTPRNGGAVWDKFKEAADIMMKGNEPTEKFISSSKALPLFQSLNKLLLLQSLTPLNQSRLLLILSYLMMSPKISRELRKQVTEIIINCLSGFRSPWIFDFIPSSYFLNHLRGKINSSEQIEILVRLIMNRVCRTDNYLHDFETNVVTNQSGEEDGSDHIYCIFLESISEVVHNKKKATDDTITRILTLISDRLSKRLYTSFTSSPTTFSENSVHIRSLNSLIDIGDKTAVKPDIQNLVHQLWTFSLTVTNLTPELLTFVVAASGSNWLDLQQHGHVVNLVRSNLFESDRDSRKAKRQRVDNSNSVDLLKRLIPLCQKSELENLYHEILKLFHSQPEPSQKVLHGLTCILSASREIRQDQDKMSDLLLQILFKTSACRDKEDQSCMASFLKLTHLALQCPNLKSPVIQIAFDIVSLSLSTKQGRIVDVETLIAGQQVLMELLSSNTIKSSSLAVFCHLCCLLMEQTLLISQEEVTASRSKELAVIEKSVQGLERLISSLTAIPEFPPFAPTLISFYVTTAKGIAIDHRVKATFTTCIYRVLKACKEGQKDELERLFVLQDPAGKVLWKHLTSNYEKYYRYKGYV